ncbi:carboxymuconolactone decarboxylase family protein [Cellulomonas sp.]|uniref:carboxymuconolactone decarboxylase family protein n=1 Tax=Cellulomonas sp. TaxID=40001 RepID=UPI001B0CC58A|nr:carboxymuconolactone decarboxylase family protein [Cellulomonas sp.]MBO9556891.1 carboxymuconolactone decarboxylase family protein [Cellulomonas sp.]
MPRLVIHHHAPEGYRAVAALDAYVARHLDRVLLDLVKLRASQLNGCAYCVDLHATDLEDAGVPTRKLHGVGVWRETPFFTDRERAALALTEQVTLLPAGVDDATWDAAAREFPERELADLVLAIGTINLWNRIAVPTRTAPPPLG